MGILSAEATRISFSLFLPLFLFRSSYRYSNYSQRENSEEPGARNYTEGRTALLSYLIFFGEQSRPLDGFAPAVLLSQVLSDKERRDLRAGKYMGDLTVANERCRTQKGWKLDGHRRLPHESEKKRK